MRVWNILTSLLSIISTFYVIWFITYPYFDATSSAIYGNIQPIFVVYLLEFLNVGAQAWLYDSKETRNFFGASDFLPLIFMGGFYILMIYALDYNSLVFAEFTNFVSRIIRVAKTGQNTSSLTPLVIFIFSFLISIPLSWLLPSYAITKYFIASTNTPPLFLLLMIIIYYSINIIVSMKKIFSLTLTTVS